MAGDQFALGIASELRDFMNANPIGRPSGGPARGRRAARGKLGNQPSSCGLFRVDAAFCEACGRSSTTGPSSGPREHVREPATFSSNIVSCFPGLGLRRPATRQLWDRRCREWLVEEMASGAARRSGLRVVDSCTV